MRVFIALGSNRGNRAANLTQALAQLPSAGVHVIQVSSFLKTQPSDMNSRAWFLNAVLTGETDLPPQVLVRRLLSLERRLGRSRAGAARRKAPRTLDLDLIFYGRARLRSRTATVPHPRFALRPFVLRGLAQLAPAWHPPHSPRNLRQWAQRSKNPC